MVLPGQIRGSADLIALYVVMPASVSGAASIGSRCQWGRETSPRERGHTGRVRRRNRPQERECLLIQTGILLAGAAHIQVPGAAQALLEIPVASALGGVGTRAYFLCGDVIPVGWLPIKPKSRGESIRRRYQQIPKYRFDLRTGPGDYFKCRLMQRDVAGSLNK